MQELNWIDDAEGFKVIAKEYKAFVSARDAFEKAARAKLNAKAFSYRQGKVSAGCAKVEAKNGMAGAVAKLRPEQRAALLALLQG